MPAETITGRDVHHDVPLANLAIAAFQSTEAFVGPRLFPAIDVAHETDRYYVIDRDSWLLVPQTVRARKTAPRRIEWRVSSDAYVVKNYALAGEIAKEDLANADAALRVRENTTRFVAEALLRDLEVRLANLVTSGSNVGSYVALSGAAKWSDFVNSDPIADVSTGHAFVENQTGLHANTLVVDKDTYRILRRHPAVLDLTKRVKAGFARDEDLQDAFEVDRIWVARGIANKAPEAATASIVNIWGNNALLAYVAPEAVGLQTATLGLAFRWRPEGIPAPMQVVRYDDPDPGKKVEVLEVGYYQDERIVAKNLGYLIASTL
jgi:hypothetical protein